MCRLFLAYHRAARAARELRGAAAPDAAYPEGARADAQGAAAAAHERREQDARGAPLDGSRRKGRLRDQPGIPRRHVVGRVRE